MLSAAILSILLACTPAPVGEELPDSDSGGGGGGTTTPGTDLTWHADVRPLIERSCAGCHDGSSGAGGFSLATYADVSAWALAIREAVASRTMPPWLASGDCRSYVGDFSLTDAEIDTIVGWIDGGHPEGDAADWAGAVEPWTPASLDRVDLTLEMASAYTPAPQGGLPDDYRCFVLEWPYETDVWVTGYEFQPGNTDVVHHIIPFIIPPDDAADFRALDEADPGEGYGCYGSPGGDILALARIGWLGSWAPGSSAATAPEGLGLKIKAGSLIVLQVHYNVAGDGAGADQSGVDVRVETTPQGWMSIQPWTDIVWVAGLGMEIPAQTEGVQHTFSYTAQEGERFQINAAALHMHTLGQSGRLEVIRSSGETECVLDVPRYDFNWQRDYRLETPVLVEPGDVVRLSCVWDNPTDQDVAWGDSTSDEMCLGVTELISAP